MPDSSGAHVKRVFRMDDNGIVDPDIWIDVLRLDVVPANFQSDGTGAVAQTYNCFFYWNDDPKRPTPGINAGDIDSQGENGNSSRKTEQLEIFSPDAPKDSSQSVKLWVINNLYTAFSGDGSDTVNQLIYMIFKNLGRDKGGADSTREIKYLQIYNNDLGGMKMSDADGSNPVIMDWLDYLDRGLRQGVIDKSQYLTVEAASRTEFNFQTNADIKTLGGVLAGILGQTVTLMLRAQDLVDLQEFFGAGSEDSDPAPIRTDSLQIIINYGFGGLAVIFGPHDADAPKPETPTPKTRSQTKR